MDSVEERAREVYASTVRELRESAPKILVNLGIVILLWAFTKYVFIPLSAEYALLGIPLPQLISAIMLVAVALLIMGIARECLDLVDAAATYAAYEFGARRRANEEEVENYRVGLRSVLYVAMAALLFTLFKEFLDMLHPALSAVMLLAIAVWAIFTLVRAGRAFSRLAEYYAREWAEKLESRLAGEGGGR
ncbi:MAG: hypothetical protein DRK00_05375 [Thermoprotei archaeon]|nr:MAG: hypothetical protein DRK00_05375 [Thermoprotei archaeon]